MMAKIEVMEYGQLEVLDSLGYNQDIGAHSKEVRLPDGTAAIVVKRGGAWKCWSARDRIEPLREAIEKGWPHLTRGRRS